MPPSEEEPNVVARAKRFQDCAMTWGGRSNDASNVIFQRSMAVEGNAVACWASKLDDTNEPAESVVVVDLGEAYNPRSINLAWQLSVRALPADRQHIKEAFANDANVTAMEMPGYCASLCTRHFCKHGHKLIQYFCSVGRVRSTDSDSKAMFFMGSDSLRYMHGKSFNALRALGSDCEDGQLASVDASQSKQNRDQA